MWSNRHHHHATPSTPVTTAFIFVTHRWKFGKNYNLIRTLFHLTIAVKIDNVIFFACPISYLTIGKWFSSPALLISYLDTRFEDGSLAAFQINEGTIIWNHVILSFYIIPLPNHLFFDLPCFLSSKLNKIRCGAGRSASDLCQWG